jgi:hypothetical protein
MNDRNSLSQYKNENYIHEDDDSTIIDINDYFESPVNNTKRIHLMNSINNGSTSINNGSSTSINNGSSTSINNGSSTSINNGNNGNYDKSENNIIINNDDINNENNNTKNYDFINEDNSINNKKIKINNLSPEWGIMLTMQENLNIRIGTLKCKKYLSATFWNYISTPINFTITLLTALSAGQTGTQSQFLSTTQLFYILFVSFILSTANTFFNLKEKSKINYISLKTIEKYGSEFEKIYYLPILSDDDIKKKLKYYRELQQKINSYLSKEPIEYANYITEFIFIFFKNFQSLKQINNNERFWVLDGRPVKDYMTYTDFFSTIKDYKVNVNELFKHNFNKDGKEKQIKELKQLNSRLEHQIKQLKIIIYDIDKKNTSDQSSSQKNTNADISGNNTINENNSNIKKEKNKLDPNKFEPNEFNKIILYEDKNKKDNEQQNNSDNSDINSYDEDCDINSDDNSSIDSNNSYDKKNNVWKTSKGIKK